MNSKNPTSREKQEHEDSGHAVYRSWCAAEQLGEEERGRTISIVAFDYGFLTQENAAAFPILICRDSWYGQTGATCCERKGPQHTPFHLLLVPSEILYFVESS